MYGPTYTSFHPQLTFIGCKWVCIYFFLPRVYIFRVYRSMYFLPTVYINKPRVYGPMCTSLNFFTYSLHQQNVWAYRLSTSFTYCLHQQSVWARGGSRGRGGGGGQGAMAPSQTVGL